MMRIFIATTILSIFIDLFTKTLAAEYITKQVNIIGDFVFFRFIENPGIAFSIMFPGFIIKTLTIILIIGIFCYYYVDIKKLNSTLLNIAFGLIIGGAIANGYERIFNEKVIDFIGVKYFSIFNLADSFITIGAIIFVLFYIFKKND